MSLKLTETDNAGESLDGDRADGPIEGIHQNKWDRNVIGAALQDLYVHRRRWGNEAMCQWNANIIS